MDKRKMLDIHCDNQVICEYCPLNTDEFTCGRGFSFIPSSLYDKYVISDEEVNRAYDKVFGNESEVLE